MNERRALFGTAIQDELDKCRSGMLHDPADLFDESTEINDETGLPWENDGGQYNDALLRVRHYAIEGEDMMPPLKEEYDEAEEFLAQNRVSQKT